MAAYRRRQQGMAERTPKWSGPRGHLRLSRLTAFEREQEIEAERQGRRAYGAKHRQEALSSQLALALPEPKRPPTSAELDAMTEAELLALVPRKPEPLPDDWMLG
jgi:hypothetical protein